MRVEGAATSAHAFNRFRDIARFAISKDYEDAPAVEALAELRGLVAEGFLVPAGYELCRQMNYRHLHDEVATLFPAVFKADKNRRRAYQSVRDYAWALKGLHATLQQSGGGLPADFKDSVVEAKVWLEEAVAYGHAGALDKVLLAYVRGILGLPAEESLEALTGLNPLGKGIIDELEDLVKKKPEGAGSGLLLGLSDPAVWDQIGTYLKTWTGFKELAIRFYEMARLLEPAHPMHSFNKALVLADLGRTEESKVALGETDKKGGNRRNWYRANQTSIEQLRLRLKTTGKG